MRYLIKEQEGVYNRLFTKILDSSIWLEPSSTRIVWVTLLAAMDEDGFAHFSAIENLAGRARVTVEEAQKAIDCFTAPDPNSANTAFDGRRVERIPGGFLILNASEHRKTFNREIRREQNRLRVAKCRAKKAAEEEGNKDSITQALPSVTSASACTVTCTEREEEVQEKKGKPTNLQQVVAYAREIGLPETDGHYYWDKWQAGGYVNAGKPIRDWKALIRSHKSAGYCPSQKKHIGPSSFQKPDPTRTKLDEEYDQWQRAKNLKKQ